jgi:hypothetical protein
MFLTALSVIACASQSLSPLKLQDRRLEVCVDKVGLCYYHKVCKKTKWYKKPKCYWSDGFVPFEDEKKRTQLRDMQFTCTSPLRFKTP